MTMKKKLTVTTLAASIMFASIAGLPLSEQGLANKLGITAGIASAATVSTTSYLDQVNALHTELAKDESGIASIRTLRDYVKEHPVTDKDQQYALTKEVWDKIKIKAPSIQYDAIYQLISGLELFYDETGTSIEALLSNGDYRDAISELFTSVGLEGIDHPDGLKKSDVELFQSAAMTALNNKTSELLIAAASAFASGNADALKAEINEIVTTDVVAANSGLLISKLLTAYGITLSDLNTVQNRIANYIDAASNSTVAHDARTAIESAGLRYILKDKIQYTKAAGSTTSSEKPLLKVVYGSLEFTFPSDSFEWSAPVGSGIRYDEATSAFVLTGNTDAVAKVEARDSNFGLLLYISDDNHLVSLKVPTGGNTDGNSSGSTGGGPVTPDPGTVDLNNLAKELEGASEEKKQEIFQKAQEAVKNALQELATLDLSKSIKVEGDTAKPTLNVTELADKVKEIGAKAKVLNDQLKQLNPNATVEKIQLKLDFGSITAKTTEIPLGKALLDAAIANGVNTVAISMNGLSLGVSPTEFGADTSLKVTNQDSKVATSATQLPVAAGVYEFEFTAGGTHISNFNTPVEVTIPVPNGSKFDTELLSLAKIVDGKLEFYGGSYENGVLNALRTGFSTYTVVENKVEFGDTASVKAWAGRQIQVAASKGILEGRADQSFVPNGQVTRAEFAKMIVKTFSLESATATENFTDVNDSDWFKVYVASAVKNGIVNGKEAGKFDPNGNITRAEMAVMSSRALALKGISLSPAKVDEALKGFTDVNAINASLKSGVALAASEGIVIGEEGNVFNPNANSTRAQAAVVIYRLLNK
ncbi:hypothetical protein GC096_10905 [Paenibacillus sp. LMG 31461]|uniref:SLH domain-containing protein n=1 Tax=Paenibacillus plantarum TaxID=2654975 RepID=A0ABX1X940_9BACL|nr:S-layer homology domain-containing protein [Paenibacillus plantarum]NOU64538.1 hypothetical protein [Paenibacillus plantarum]